MTELPAGWTRAKFSDFGTWMGGGTPSKAVPAYWGGPIPWVSPKDMKTKIIRSAMDGITADAVEKSAAKLIPAGSVLVVTRSGILSHTLPVAVTAVETTLNQDLKALALSNGIDAEFIAMGLRAFEQSILNDCRKGGTTVHSIEMPSLNAFELPIPPTNEQRRIVEKIEAMFERIDKGVENLRAAKATLALYRQSLLKSAFEGRLTTDWRAQNADKLEDPKTLLARIQKERDARYKAALDEWQTALTEWRAGSEKGKKPTKPKRLASFPDDLRDLQIKLPELPHGWRWAHLGWCSSGPAYGTATKSSDTGKVPVIRMGNLLRGRIDWQNLAYTSEPKEIDQYSLKSGDVLFNRTNSPELVGKTSIYKGERPAIFAGYLVRVNQIKEIASGPYLTYFLNSPLANEHGKTVKTDGVNQSNINASKLQEYPFPFCSPAEQAEITRILDARLDAADKMEAEIDASLTRADALRQSILKQAFAGKLVPQDPTDEPATTLLARIKAERAKAPKPARTRKATA